MKTQINPNMPVSEAIKLAKSFGCKVNHKKRHGEIVFKHKKNNMPFVISNNKNGIGKGFISWMKPVIGDDNDIKLNQKSQAFEIAKIIYNLDKSAFTTQTILNVTNKYTKQQLNVQLSYLMKKDILKRLDVGLYQKTENLNKIFNTPEQIQKVIDQVMKKDTQQSNYIDQIVSANQEKQISENKEEDIAQNLIEQPISKDLDNEEKFIKRFEKCIEKFETLLKRFEIEADMKDILYLFEETFKKKRGL
ncbi:MAG: hypothetical protein ACOC2W_00210 [bacterium]